MQSRRAHNESENSEGKNCLQKKKGKGAPKKKEAALCATFSFAVVRRSWSEDRVDERDPDFLRVDT